MEMIPRIFFGKVMHRRIFPKENRFLYRTYYLALPLSTLASLKSGIWLGINKLRPLSFFTEDHRTLTADIRDILQKNNAQSADGDIILITMPRIIGYVFNPISFWMCYDKQQELRAVICEVNNTFGENHNYLCVHEDQRIIQKEDVFEADKIFHVSPFMQREGSYSFRFHIDEDNFGAWIDYFDGSGQKKLVTSLMGKFHPLNQGNIIKAFFTYPLITFKIIYLIHFQALVLLLKGIKYVSKPKQMHENLSRSGKITKS